MFPLSNVLRTVGLCSAFMGPMGRNVLEKSSSAEFRTVAMKFGKLFF